MDSMTILEFLLFVGVGCGVGFLAGFFGVGGGILLVPVLLFSYGKMGLPSSVFTHIAIGTSLFVIVFASLASAYQHSKQKSVDRRAVLFIGFSSAFSAFLTAHLASGLSGKTLQMFFGSFVILIGVQMVRERGVQAQKRFESSSGPNIFGLLGVGIIAGTISAIGGLGGGAVTIPMMYYLLHMPLKLAIGTSSATIVITALFSVAGYIVNGIGHTDLPDWTLGFVDLQHGVALAIGTIIMGRVGAYVSFKTHPIRLRKLFAFYNIIIGIYILLR